jgi:hypothetical protein
MASSACCDAGEPLAIEYAPKGTFTSVGDLPIYTTGAGAKGVVVVYDIFGFAYNQVQRRPSLQPSPGAIACSRLACSPSAIAWSHRLEPSPGAIACSHRLQPTGRPPLQPSNAARACHPQQPSSSSSSSSREQQRQQQQQQRRQPAPTAAGAASLTPADAACLAGCGAPARAGLHILWRDRLLLGRGHRYPGGCRPHVQGGRWVLGAGCWGHKAGGCSDPEPNTTWPCGNRAKLTTASSAGMASAAAP